MMLFLLFGGVCLWQAEIVTHDTFVWLLHSLASFLGCMNGVSDWIFFLPFGFFVSHFFFSYQVVIYEILEWGTILRCFLGSFLFLFDIHCAHTSGWCGDSIHHALLI
jgi:hypothetical protein